MHKFSIEERVYAVKRHFEKGESYATIAKSMRIGKSTIGNWCANYESMGASVFCHTQNNHYTLEFKEKVVKDYLNGGGSQQEICKKYKISSSGMLSNWISLYNGHELKTSPGGEYKIMTTGRKTTLEERIRIVEHCIRNNLNYNESAQEFKVSYQQVYQWVQKYNHNGVNGLVDRRGRSKPVTEMTGIEKLKAENRLLKAELEQKELENIFLKKLEEIERRRY